VARLLPTLLVLGLLGGTAAAFALTEGLKLEKSPVTNTRIDRTFSPVCSCSKAVAHISFRLRKKDRITVAIVRDGKVVRTIVRRRHARRGTVSLSWDGRDDAGSVVAEGPYKARVHFDRAHRTIVLPNTIRVDTTPPTISLVRLRPTELSPDGDYRHEMLRVRYRINEPAHAILYVDGKRRVFGRFERTVDELRWFGRVGGRGVRPGVHRLALAARDLAGNLSRPREVGSVRVRYVELPRRIVHARAGTRFGVHVATDAPNVVWILGKRTGVGRRALVLRAPDRPGRYRLVVRANGHSARTVVLVEPRA
jgi:hypothetical protein